MPYFPNLARVARFPEIRVYESKIRDDIRKQSQDHKNEGDPNHIASLITSEALDKSLLLDEMVEDYYGSLDALIGEIQLCFILFLILFFLYTAKKS